MIAGIRWEVHREAGLAGNQWFESSYPTGPRHRHRVQFVQFVALLTLPDDDFTKP